LLFAQFALVIGACMKRARAGRGALLAAAAVTALLVNFLMQEHALTLATSLPFWLLGALAMTQHVRVEVPRTAKPSNEPADIDLVPEAPELLAMMFDDFRAADATHALASARLSYVGSLVADLGGLESIRRRSPSARYRSPQERQMRAEVSTIDLQVAL